MVGGKKLKKIGIIQPYLFEDQLILAFSKDWINVFGKLPCFVVVIDEEGKIVLQSEPCDNIKRRVSG